MSREDISWGIAHSEWAKGTLLKEWRARIHVPEYSEYSGTEKGKWTEWLQDGGNDKLISVVINGDPGVLTPEEEAGWIFYLSWAAHHKPLNEELKCQFWESHAEDVFLNGPVPGANEKYGYPYWYGQCGDCGYGKDYIIPSRIIEKWNLPNQFQFSDELLAEMGLVMLQERLEDYIGPKSHRYMICPKGEYEAFKNSLFRL